MNFDIKQLKEMSKLAKSGAIFAVRNSGSDDIKDILEAGDIFTVLFANYFNQKYDKFILSSIKFVSLYYSILSLLGYNIPYLRDFKKTGGLPAHPEKYIQGIDLSTGLTGHGIANSLGLALTNTKGRVFCIVDDNDIKSGIFYESVIFAENNNIKNLVFLWISENSINIKFDNIIECNANNLENINSIFKELKCNKITTIKFKTKTFKDINILDLEKKFASSIGLEYWAKLASVNKNNSKKEIINKQFNINIPNIKNEFITTTILTLKYIELLLKNNKKDLYIIDSTDFLKEYMNKSFYINVKNNLLAGAGLVNGLASQNKKIIFVLNLIDFDTIKPFVRVASISNLSIVFLLLNDGFTNSQKGTLFIPTEQIASIRQIPNLNTFRPATLGELEFCFNYALNEYTKPSCLIVSKRKIRFLGNNKNYLYYNGGYIIYDSKNPKITLITTGSEVSIAISVAEHLKNIRVVSIPSIELFRKSPSVYKKTLLKGFVIAIEPTTTYSWYEFADAVIGVDRFGFTCDKNTLYNSLGFSFESLIQELHKYV